MNFKNLKLTDRDKFLLTVFIVCLVLVGVLAWSLYRPEPDLHGKIIDKAGNIITCTDGGANWGRSYSPTNGECK